ncbi:hypothetical protein OGAPHI_005491 [Ogataea philodendri]|uniref:60S acidic ribosomal protein P2 n=1 Tax=Ogataea philodendri TaxID=1378263 RepID=A0A9P8NXU6_9ASCO|nr:uncharacterized protein OGAPHI_005491 [Ogataea philodendri]KAH3662243.1 hypothetical protein OGAPHI_005491 [Ogataea philodendri]
MFLRWVLTRAGFSFGPAASLAALNFLIKPFGLVPKPLENLLLTLAWHNLAKSALDNSKRSARSTPLYEKVLKAGNSSPSAADVTKVLQSVGVEVESEKLDKLIAEVEGKSVEELIAEGTEKMSSVPAGAPAAAGAGAAAAGSTEAAAEEEAAEEEEEEDDDMGFGLFD